NFSSALYVWFVGLPILTVFFIFYSADDSEEIFAQNINESKNGDEIRRHIRLFLKLGDNRNEKKSEILLKGYVYTHEENCTILDCPLKKYKKYLDQGPQMLKNNSFKNNETESNSLY